MDVREEMKTVEAIDQFWEGKEEPRRGYMGISGLGAPCDRRIWMQFRWMYEEKLEPRVKRLLDRGHREEAVVVKNLRAIGCEVSCTGNKQTEVVLNPWVKGHVDGIIQSGLPESPHAKHILEIKTSNDKAFKDLQKNGVRKAKPQHYAQMQMYMLGTGIGRAMYVVINKNDDAIYTERVKLDEPFARQMAEKGLEIALSHDAPPGISVNPSWFECKMCPAWGLCHAGQHSERSCRSCEHCVFDPKGFAWCDLTHKRITQKAQVRACESYEEIRWN